MDRWQTYHQQTKSRQPASLLREALPYVKRMEAALDFGAGALVDSRFLLQQEFERVVAVDGTPFESIDNPHFEFIEAKFEKYNFSPTAFDLVNAQYALPFILPKLFPEVWAKLRTSLVSGGVFCGQFFGVQDTWSSNPTMSFHTTEQVEKLLVGMETLKLEEVEKDGSTAAGTVKHWHTFNIIARA